MFSPFIGQGHDMRTYLFYMITSEKINWKKFNFDKF